MQVQPKAPLLQILRVAGAQEEIFTLKEVGTACCQCEKCTSVTAYHGYPLCTTLTKSFDQPLLFLRAACLSCIVEKGAALT